MEGRFIHAVTAAVVLLVAGVFLGFAYAHGGVKPIEGYGVSAVFSDAGGVSAGDDIRISGIKAGVVDSVAVDPHTENAVVWMTIRNGTPVPVDSLAAISNDSMLGGAYIALRPGHSRQLIAPGGRIAKVRNYRSLEATVGKMIFSASGRPGASMQ